MLISKDEKHISWFSNFCNQILKNGPIPRHIAIIMDGNRRFAHNLNLDLSQGHMKGMDSLFDTLFWCRNLGICEVTVYAFSLENFKRSKQEVDCLMQLAFDKFSGLLNEKEKLDEYGLRIRFIGRLELLPLQLQKTLAEVTKATTHHNRCCLNVCISYTSRDEIASAVSSVTSATRRGDLLPSDIDARLIGASLQLPYEPDLLIRTSGEVRLSDFLLWQSSYSVLAFLDVLWPAFTCYHLNLAVIYYQRHYEAIQKVKKERSRLFLENEELELIRLNGNENLANSRTQKKYRTETFLRNLKESRDISLNYLLNKL